MRFFGKKDDEGGLMDVIRCDEKEYLIWKWKPSGQPNSTKKENAIRYGSSIRVKSGEAAVFFYKQSNGVIEDIIIGPYDNFLKTENIPILTSLISLGWDGNSPFNAEVYYFNLQGNIKLKFGTSSFDLFDRKFENLGIPCNVRGSINFNITDIPAFIKLNRLQEFNLQDFSEQIRDFCTRKIKSVVTNIALDDQIPVMQIERKIDDVSDIIKSKLKQAMQDDFGINLMRFDVSEIELDKSHSNYNQLKKITIDQTAKKIEATTDIEIENISELARINRRDAELGVEGKNFLVHQLNQQTDVSKTAAESLGKMSNVNLGSGDGFNPAGLMFGMGIGGVMGNQVGGMVNNMFNSPPPPQPHIQFHISINGQQAGPFSIEQLKHMIINNQFTKQHYVWKPGMAGWELASQNSELNHLFTISPPPPPPPPPGIF
jgi:membrane protease subunit (stomatin/prohibitin family)